MLAFAREGYRWRDFFAAGLMGSAELFGFLAVGRKTLALTARAEMRRSVCKSAFVRALQRLVPEIRSLHLTAARGVRGAEAVDPAGRLIDDFAICASPSSGARLQCARHRRPPHR